MKSNKITSLLRTTSLVAGVLILPACTSGGSYHSSYGDDRSLSPIPVKSVITDEKTKKAPATTTHLYAVDATGGGFITQENENGFVVELVALDGDGNNDNSENNDVVTEGGSLSPVSFVVYDENFNPELVPLSVAVTTYGDEFGPDVATESSSIVATAASTHSYEVEFGPQFAVETAYRHYDSEHGVTLPELYIAGDEKAEIPFAQNISDGELSTYRGAFAQETTFSAENADQVNANILTGTSANNVATNVITGSNNITPGAINFNGVGSFILNSGNNAVVQNSTIINLNLVTSTE